MSRPNGALPDLDALPQRSNVPDRDPDSQPISNVSTATVSEHELSMDISSPATPTVSRYRRRALSLSSPTTPPIHRRITEVDEQATPTPANISRILDLSNGIGGISLGGDMIVAASLVQRSQPHLVQPEMTNGVTEGALWGPSDPHNLPRNTLKWHVTYDDRACIVYIIDDRENKSRAFSVTITRYHGRLLHVHPVPDPSIIDEISGGIRIAPVDYAGTSILSYIPNPDTLRHFHLTATRNNMERVEIFERAPSPQPIFVVISTGAIRDNASQRPIPSFKIPPHQLVIRPRPPPLSLMPPPPRVQESYPPSAPLINRPKPTEVKGSDRPEPSLQTSVLQWQASVGEAAKESQTHADEDVTREGVQYGVVDNAEGQNSAAHPLPVDYDSEEEFKDLYSTAEQIAEENARRARRNQDAAASSSRAGNDSSQTEQPPVSTTARRFLLPPVSISTLAAPSMTTTSPNAALPTIHSPQATVPTAAASSSTSGSLSTMAQILDYRKRARPEGYEGDNDEWDNLSEIESIAEDEPPFFAISLSRDVYSQVRAVLALHKANGIRGSVKYEDGGDATDPSNPHTLSPVQREIRRAERERSNGQRDVVFAHIFSAARFVQLLLWELKPDTSTDVRFLDQPNGPVASAVNFGWCIIAKDVIDTLRSDRTHFVAPQLGWDGNTQVIRFEGSPESIRLVVESVLKVLAGGNVLSASASSASSASGDSESVASGRSSRRNKKRARR